VISLPISGSLKIECLIPLASALNINFSNEDSSVVDKNAK
jgi:hypothetical protein